MKTLLKNLDRRFQLTRPGSVLILVVALLVLMALIGTAFLSTQRVDRYATVQHTNNTEIDLLLEGVKNMAKATIVGSLNDPSLPFPYRPANSTIAKNWDAPDLFHHYTDDPLIGTTPNDAWLSPRCPTILTAGQFGGPKPPPNPPTIVWPCIGEPLTGNTFESPFVGTGSPTMLRVAGVSLTYRDRMTSAFIPPPAGSVNPPYGSNLTPGFGTIAYPDGTMATYPVFAINVTGTINGPFDLYLAGDADGDGIADCGMFKLPVGEIDGVTYYAGVRIIDNCGAVNVNTAMSRRYDFTGAGLPTRPIGSAGTASFQGVYSLGCFGSNVGLAELLQTYDGSANNNSGSLGTEFGAWMNYLLGNRYITSPQSVSPAPGSTVVTPPATGFNVPTETDVLTVAGTAPIANPIPDSGPTPRTDFAFTTLGDMLTSQIGRRPSYTGYSALNSTLCLDATDTDAAALAYHFVFNNPNATRTPVEQILHSSLYDSSPNGIYGPPNRLPSPLLYPTIQPLPAGAYPGVGSTSYVGNENNSAAVVQAWYLDNFDWSGDFLYIASGGSGTANYAQESCMSVGTFESMSVASSSAGSLLSNTDPRAGASFLPRRSIFTANSAVSNLTPRPVLTSSSFTYAANGSITITSGMSPITPTMCKASINTATFPDLWRAFWLAMAGDNGLSPLGTNSGSTITDHALQQNQSIYTGSTFTDPAPTDALLNPKVQNASGFVTNPADTTQSQCHPQAMFRSSLRNPTNVFYGNGSYSYIEPDQMVLLRSAIAAANVEAMRDPLKGSSANIHAHDLKLTATIGGAQTSIYARVYGVSQQPYITEVYANTNESPNTDGDPFTAGKINSVPYVAVELFNPYNQDINLNGWQLATIDRSPTSNNIRAVTVIHSFTSADIVPHYTASPTTGTTYYQGGYALLENYNAASPGQVQYRPASTNLPWDGSITAAYSSTTGGPVNDIVVTELSQVIAANPSYSNQELVLLRPATSPSRPEYVAEAVDQVPVDSFDFTGLQTGVTDSNGPIADVWHYVRGNQLNNATPVVTNSLWRFIYPGRYDATDPTPYNATANSAVAPNPVPNGSNRSYTAYAYQAFSRRQQGTQAGRFHPVATGATSQDPFYKLYSPSPNCTLGGTVGNDNTGASYPVTFPFQYLNNDDPGPRPLLQPVTLAPPTFNSAPFGQFARNSDILQVPFVGAYLILSSQPATIPAAGQPNAGIAPQVTSSTIIEANAVPMDCSFAEDTDLTDDPPAAQYSETNVAPTADPYIWSESVGHFAPVNTQAYNYPSQPGYDNQNFRHVPTPNFNRLVADSDPSLSNTNSGYATADPYTPYKTQYTSDPLTQEYWRYHWASRVFDYLTVQNPNDDYFPNVQQSIYNGKLPASSPPQAYGTFTVGQTLPVPVQNTSLISSAASVSPSNPYVEDTVPVYGLININTAPWRVLSALRLCPFDDAEIDPNANNTVTGNSLAGQFVITKETGAVAPYTTVSTTSPPPPPDNVQLARAIAYWRDFGPNVTNLSTQVNSPSGTYPYSLYKGPFTSIADILNVPAVQNYLYEYNQYSTPAVSGTPNITNNQKQSPEPGAVQGHLSPSGFNGASQPLTDGVRNDVEERFDLLSRLSNQITVKSDVYTVYIVIQGWRNAGWPNFNNPPRMVSQKRAAFIIDRTGVTPTSSNVKIINVPTD